MAGVIETDIVAKPTDWSDIIANVQRDNTPFTSMAQKRERPKQVTHRWQVEKYPEVGHGGVLDNLDADTFQANPRVEVDGVSQKSWWNPKVSDFSEEVEVAGLSKGEMAKQIAIAAVAVKWMIERRGLSNNDCLLESPPKNGNETRGMLQWGNPAAQAKYPVDANFRPAAAQQYTGTLGAFGEPWLLAANRSSYIARKGSGKMDAFLGIQLKAKYTDMGGYQDDAGGKTPVRRLNQNAEDETYVKVIDKLVLDTGEVDLHPTSHLYVDANTGQYTNYSHRSGLQVDMSMTGLAFMRRPQFKMLPNMGGGPRGIFDTIFMWMCDNPVAIITQLIQADN